MSEQTRTILAVNASHQTALESAFWANFAAAAAAAEWRLVSLAARDIPDVAHTDTIRIPLRLSDLAADHAALPARDLVELPPWLTEEDVARHVEWEHRRFRLHRFNPEVEHGAIRLAWMADRVVRTLRPGIVLTTNKIDHPCAFFRSAAQHHGADAGMIERSPLDSIWYEPDGLFAESLLWDAAATIGSDRTGVDERHRLGVVANPAGFRVEEASTDVPELAGLPRPIVFLPFDNVLWTGWGQRDHPQNAVDNPAFATPQDAVDAVAAWAADQGGSLVLKSHPSCVETSSLGRPPNTYLVEGALDHLVAGADVVAAFNTKVAFVALAQGAPVATLADNAAAATGLTVHWRDHESVEATLAAALAGGGDTIPVAGVDQFFTWMAQEYFYGALPEDPRPPATLLRSLISDVAGQPDALGAAAVDRAAAVAAGHLDRADTTSRGARRVVLDVSRLVDPRSTHSGIARYGREILTRLVREPSVEVWALVREPGRGWTLANAALFRRLHVTTGGRVIPVRIGSDAGQVIRDRVGQLGPEDVVHSIHLPLPPRRQTHDARRVVTVHDVLHLIEPELHPGKGAPTISHVLDAIDPTLDLVVCDSEKTRRDLLTLVPIAADRTVTVPLGVTEGPPTTSAREPFVTALLQAEPRKNAGVVVEAVASVLARHPDVRFVALVSGGAERIVRDALADSGLDPARVDVLSGLDDAQVGDILRRAQAFVFGSRYEGFGLPVLEAMAEGCPVVTPFSSSLAEVAGDAAAFAMSESVHDLAEALDAVLSMPGYAQTLEVASWRRAAEMSWEHSVAHLLRVYSMADTATS